MCLHPLLFRDLECKQGLQDIDAVAVLMNRTHQELGRRMEALGIKPDLKRRTNSFMTDYQIRLALDGDLSPSGYRNTARIASDSNPVHYLPVWNIRRGGPGDPGAVILGGGRRVQTVANNEQAAAVRTAAAQLAVGAQRGPVEVGQ